MISMTGYSNGEYVIGENLLSVEIKSFNNKYLDINIRMPYLLSSFEPRVKEIIKKSINRGKVEVFINFKEKQHICDVSVDLKLADRYYAAFKTLLDNFNIREDIRLGHFLRIDGLFNIEDKRDLDGLWMQMEPHIIQILQSCVDKKKLEGANTKKDIIASLDSIKNDLEKIRTLYPLLSKQIEEKIRKRLEELLKDQDIDENRLLQEVGLLAIKQDINEEIERLRSHIKLFDETINGDGAVGRQLEFIALEMLREITTIGSKSNNSEVIANVINMKTELEKIREQIRNVE